MDATADAHRHKHTHRKGRGTSPRSGLGAQAKQLEVRLKASCDKGTILDDAGLSASHGKSRHLATSMTQMLDRLWYDPSVTTGAVSSYEDKAALRRAVRSVLAANAQKVARWSCDLYGSGDRKLELDAVVTGPGAHGVGAPDGHTGPVVPLQPERDVVVLERAPESWLGFRILTAYPEARHMRERPGGPHDLRPALEQSRRYRTAAPEVRAARSVLCSGQAPHCRAEVGPGQVTLWDSRVPLQKAVVSFSRRGAVQVRGELPKALEPLVAMWKRGQE